MIIFNYKNHVLVFIFFYVYLILDSFICDLFYCFCCFCCLSLTRVVATRIILMDEFIKHKEYNKIKEQVSDKGCITHSNISYWLSFHLTIFYLYFLCLSFILKYFVWIKTYFLMTANTGKYSLTFPCLLLLSR